MPAALLSSSLLANHWPLLALALIVTAPTSSSAQRLQPVFVSAHPTFDTSATPASAFGILGSGARDNRYEGLFVGLGAGTAFTIVSAVQCSGRNDCINSPYVLGLMVTALAGLTGALVGSMLPK